MQQPHQNKPKKKISLIPLLIHLAIFLGWLLPRSLGRWIATGIGKLLGSLKRNKMVKAIRANQYVIHGEKMSAEALDEIPQKVFVSAARCIFDYFHFLPRPWRLQKIVRFSPEAQATIDRFKTGQATVVVVPHLSNFDLVGYALALNDIKIQVLSFPNPDATYKVQNQASMSPPWIFQPSERRKSASEKAAAFSPDWTGPWMMPATINTGRISLDTKRIYPLLISEWPSKPMYRSLCWLCSPSRMAAINSWDRIRSQ